MHWSRQLIDLGSRNHTKTISAKIQIFDFDPSLPLQWWRSRYPSSSCFVGTISRIRVDTLTSSLEDNASMMLSTSRSIFPAKLGLLSDANPLKESSSIDFKWHEIKASCSILALWKGLSSVCVSRSSLWHRAKNIALIFSSEASEITADLPVSS